MSSVMVDLECRRFEDPVEVRSAPGGRLIITGTAIKYGARSRDLGGFRERVMPGAATQAIKAGDILALEEHRSERYLGRTGAGTLRLFDSKSELRYEIDVPDTHVGRDVAHLAERGDYRGSSFGFRAGHNTWTKDDDGTPLRTVTSFRSLRDVGPTVSPAYLDSTAEATFRSLLADEGTPIEVRNAIAQQVGIDGMRVLRPAMYRRPAHWFA